MNCRFKNHGPPTYKGWYRKRCVRCRLTLHATPHPPERCFAECEAFPLWDEWGFILSIALGFIGLDKRRWAWIVARLGLVEVPESSCSACAAREAWLNTVGGKLSKRTDRIGKWLYRLFVRRAEKA
jgi:hypothetical protein